MFALVDCNNFYVSCERVFKPHLRDQPVVVLSNNDGCIISRSNEAKAIGIPMGAPAFKYKELIEKHHVHVFSSNYPLYGDLSNRVMSLLASFTPDIEYYSIDEAFLKFEGFHSFGPEEYGKKISQKITQSTGLPISIGFAPTKALSKVANAIAKAFPDKTNGIYVIDTEEKRLKALKWMPVEKVWGIGQRYAKRLKTRNIHTAYDFISQPDKWIKKEMSIVGLRLKKELEGKPTLELESPQNKKAIATTRSFEKMYTDIEDLKERVSTFAVSCAEKLRKQKSCCNMLMVFIHSNGHRKDLPQYSKNIVLKTPYPTNSSMHLAHYAIKGLKAIYKKGYPYKKAGVIVMALTPENQKQLSLFVSENPKHKNLLKVVDFINATVGQQKIKLACQDLKRTWKMNQEMLSPRYTTKLNEIITINV